jgi:mannose-1-phosphate guanylyltransferase
MEDLSVVILAGGKGERFWPYSRVDHPKQFLSFSSGRTLLQETFQRARRLVSPERVYVVTGRVFRDLVAEQLPAMPTANIICEPVGRDTAAAIGLAAQYLATRGPGQSMLVLPADHLVLDPESFCARVELAYKVARTCRSLTTFGIRPTRPDSSFGYIKAGESVWSEGPDSVFRVAEFTEKPSSELAASFLASGSYLWNSGMFLWGVEVILDAIGRHLPELGRGLARLAPALAVGDDNSELLDREFVRLPAISIDYGVLEKEGNCVVVPADFGWDDLGTWLALERLEAKDRLGNVVRAPTRALVGASDCMVVSDRAERLVALLGTEGLLVVDTGDAVLVADKRSAPRLKDLVAHIKELGLERYLASAPTGPALARDETAAALDQLTFLSHTGEVHAKPWGHEVWWAQTSTYAAKVLFVKAGQRLSKQYHRQKHETMLCLGGRGLLELDARTHALSAGVVQNIEPGTVHRLVAETDLYILEVSSPELDDVVRLEDVYGRA